MSKEHGNHLFDLTGKVAVITGASRGLGVQFAKALAVYGADLAIVARNYEKLLETKAKIETMGRKCSAFQCDVTKEEEIEKAVEQTVSHHGKIDILVNNAGTTAAIPAEDMMEADWDKVMDTNVKGVFLFSKQVGKHMIERKYGKIINIASIWGAAASPFPLISYYSSKGAVINFTRALAAEWAKYNITVNAIGPGFFQSEISDGPYKESSMNYLKASCPMQRLGNAGELDGALLLLASDASSYITGQTIYVDGGWIAV